MTCMYAQQLSAWRIQQTLRKEGINMPLSTIKDWGSRIKKNSDVFKAGPQFSTSANPRRGRVGKRPLSERDKKHIAEALVKLPEIPLRKLGAHLLALRLHRRRLSAASRRRL